MASGHHKEGSSPVLYGGHPTINKAKAKSKGAEMLSMILKLRIDLEQLEAPLEDAI